MRDVAFSAANEENDCINLYTFLRFFFFCRGRFLFVHIFTKKFESISLLLNTIAYVFNQQQQQNSYREPNVRDKSI